MNNEEWDFFEFCIIILKIFAFICFIIAIVSGVLFVQDVSKYKLLTTPIGQLTLENFKHLILCVSLMLLLGSSRNSNK